jgi:hypothetical protein
VSDIASMPDVASQQPASGGQNKPASGTYGEGAALQQLEAQLPGTGGGPGGPGPVQPTPAPVGPGLPPRQSGALPGAIAAPTRNPDEAISTPLTTTAPVGAMPSEQRIQMYRFLATTPSVSETTRAWAQSVLASFGQ